MRRNTGAETERTRDLFVALWVPDAFMRAVVEDGDWHLMSPDACPGLTDAFGEAFDALYARYVAEGKFTKRLKARTLWQHVLQSQLETGTPYVLFKDAVNRKSNQANVGPIRSSNLCAEVSDFLGDSAAARCLAAQKVIKPGGLPPPGTPRHRVCVSLLVCVLLRCWRARAIGARMGAVLCPACNRRALSAAIAPARLHR